jgi:CBS domain-containing protein
VRRQGLGLSAWSLSALGVAAALLLHVVFTILARRGWIYWPGAPSRPGADPSGAAADLWLDDPLTEHLGLPPVVLREDRTVEDAVEAIRAAAADEPAYVYVVDAAHRLRGTVSALHLVTSPAETPLGGLVDGDPVALSAAHHRLSDALELLQRHRLLVVPVTDPSGRMLGVVGRRP